MERLSRLSGILGCAIAFATAGCATSSVPGAGPQPQANGASATHARYLGTRWAPRAALQPDSGIEYNGGPVLTKPRLYLIFWGWHKAGDPDSVEQLLLTYSKSIGGSGYDNIYTQYYGPAGRIKNPRNQYGGSWSDDTNAIPAHPTDAQVAAEALRYIKRFGYDANGSYVVATAHNHSSAGFGTAWCAYHSATEYSSKLVSYTDLPYIPDAGNNCGANFITPPADETGTDEGVTIIEGAEYGDSITDPKPPTGWDGGGEVGDFCHWLNIENDPFSANEYTSQPMFSNASGYCVQSYKKK
ncbi:MAG TPA: hypothetical protein VGX91_00730 [Candidatus Cybelea sp.]|jgi:serine protease|nr:hypothetical protein [Candidatus Cybelea sp.]